MDKYYKFPILKVLPILKDLDNFVLLQTNKYDRENRFSYLFTHPIDIIKPINFSDGCEKIFQKLESLLSSNHYLAGFLSYELGYYLDDYFKTKKHYSFPLMWLGVYNNLISFDHLTNKFHGTKLNFNSHSDFNLKKYQITNLKMKATKNEYLKNIKKIKNLIRHGETYQVNYTTKYKFDFKGCPFSFFYDMQNKQKVPYSAFIKTKDYSIISCSPELFFRKKGRDILVKPMKGTIKRGENDKEDKKTMLFLKNDLKNRSENIMIVDLFRNDLGKISEIGSVKTKNLFKVEKYETLFQMTAEIRSKLKKDVSLFELFKSIFPSGSVTGAPKIRTMEIIKDIEKENRKVYTGAIGFLSPDKDAVFNVPIRTLLIHKNKGEMGIGGGIVFDSDGEAELMECHLKAKFLTQKNINFELIETMLWKEKIYFLDLHLKRLTKSARYFEFCFNENTIKTQLYAFKKNLKKNHTYKIQLLLTNAGEISIKHHEIHKSNISFINFTKQPVKNFITISDKHTFSEDIYKFHKTTNRVLYNDEYKKYSKKGFFDVIFKNEKNQITEGSISNIFIKKGAYYYTPPLKCGLLNGIGRQILIDKKPNVIEKILTEKDLTNADAIYTSNSVRGIIQVSMK